MYRYLDFTLLYFHIPWERHPAAATARATRDDDNTSFDIPRCYVRWVPKYLPTSFLCYVGRTAYPPAEHASKVQGFPCREHGKKHRATRQDAACWAPWSSLTPSLTRCVGRGIWGTLECCLRYDVKLYRTLQMALMVKHKIGIKTAWTMDSLYAFKCKRFRNTRHTVKFGIKKTPSASELYRPIQLLRTATWSTWKIPIAVFSDF
jgi:hypothetical protein